MAVFNGSAGDIENKQNKLIPSEKDELNVTDPNEQYPSFSALDTFVQIALSRFAEENELESQIWKSTVLDEFSDNTTYPSSKAVVDYVKERLAESGVSEERVSELIVEAIISESLETANHKLQVINEEELEADDEHILYPSAKAVVAYVAKANAGKEDISNKLDDMSNVDLSELPDAYPSARAVDQALFELEERFGKYIADYNPESVDNKLTHIDEEFALDDDNHTYYPSAKGMVVYVNDKIGEIETALDNIIAIQKSLIGGEAV